MTTRYETSYGYESKFYHEETEYSFVCECCGEGYHTTRGEGRVYLCDVYCSVKCEEIGCVIVERREEFGFSLFAIGCALKGLMDAEKAWSDGEGKLGA